MANKRSKHLLPGFGLTMGVSLLYVTIIIVLPLLAMLLKVNGMGWSEFWRIVASNRSLAAYRITFSSAAIAMVFNGAFGLLLAWVLTRYSFPGKRVLDALVDLPFALPTAVAGLVLVTLFADTGWYGQFLTELGIKVAFTPLGIVVAMSFTSLPFVVRTVQPVLEDLPTEDEEAAVSMGASDWTVFRRILFPSLWPALMTGVALSFTRSLGEFGAVIFIAGNMPYVSEITSLMIFVRLQEYDYAAASAIASVVLMASLLLLLVINLWQARYLRRLQGR